MIRRLGEEPEPEELRAAKGKRDSALRTKVAEFVKGAGRWVSRGDIAKAMGRSGPAVRNHLRQLEESGEVQATGKTSRRRYGAPGLAASDEPSPPAPRLPKKERSTKTARAKNLAELGAEPRAQLPAIAEPAVTQDPRCAIEDTGLFAINDGKSTIRLSRAGIAKVVRFLELTQHVWKVAA